MNWNVEPSTLGLMFITVDVGVSGMRANAAGVSQEQQIRGIVETVLIGGAAAFLSRSWWPLAAPLMYLAFDHAWCTYYGHAPEIGASEDEGVYSDGS
jgi:hypothetical protein